MITPKRHYAGCYRLPLTDGRFAQIVRGTFTSSARWGDAWRKTENGRHWKIEIRAEDGSLVRYAGMECSLRDAVESLAPFVPVEHGGAGGRIS